MEFPENFSDIARDFERSRRTSQPKPAQGLPEQFENAFAAFALETAEGLQPANPEVVVRAQLDDDEPGTSASAYTVVRKGGNFSVVTEVSSSDEEEFFSTSPPKKPVREGRTSESSSGSDGPVRATIVPMVSAAASAEFISYMAGANVILLKNQFPHDMRAAEGLCVRGHHVLTGPTGVGKSTWAMQPLKKTLSGRLLVVQPTLVNARNFIREHMLIAGYKGETRWAQYKNTRMPLLFAQFTQVASSFDVITAGYLTAMLRADPEFLTDYACVVVDEAHVLTAEQQFVNYYLREKVEHLVFVSATPDATSIARRAIPLTIITDVDVSEESAWEDLLGSVWNPANTGTTAANRRMAFVRDLAMAQRIHAIYQERGHISVIVDENDVAAYDLAHELCAKNSCLTILVTPAASTGITVDVDLVIDSCTVSGPVISDGIALNEVRETGATEAEQRAGRGGRKGLGYVYTKPGPRPVVQPVLMTADMLLVDLLCKCHGINPPYTIVDRQYAKVLAEATPAQIDAALKVETSSLYNNIFKFDRRGLPYREFEQYANGQEVSKDDFLKTHCRTLRGFVDTEHRFYLQFCFDLTKGSPVDEDMLAVTQIEYERAVGEELIKSGVINVPRDPAAIASIIFSDWKSFSTELDTVFAAFKTARGEKWHVTGHGNTVEEELEDIRKTYCRWKRHSEVYGDARALAEIIGDKALAGYFTNKVSLKWYDSVNSVKVKYLDGGLDFDATRASSQYINIAIYHALVAATQVSFRHYVMRNHAKDHPELYFVKLPDGWRDKTPVLRLRGAGVPNMCAIIWAMSMRLWNRLMHSLNGNRMRSGFGPTQSGLGGGSAVFPGVGNILGSGGGGAPPRMPQSHFGGGNTGFGGGGGGGFGGQNVQAPKRPGDDVLELFGASAAGFARLTPIMPTVGMMDGQDWVNFNAAVRDHFRNIDRTEAFAAITVHLIQFDASPNDTKDVVDMGDITVDFDMFWGSVVGAEVSEEDSFLTKRRVANSLAPGMKRVWKSAACDRLRAVGFPRAHKAGLPNRFCWCACSFAASMNPTPEERVHIAKYLSTTRIRQDRSMGMRRQPKLVPGGRDQFATDAGDEHVE